MKSAGKARNNGLYRHIRTSKEIIRNLLNDSEKISAEVSFSHFQWGFVENRQAKSGRASIGCPAACWFIKLLKSVPEVKSLQR